jgi:hypothetical protein
MEGKMAFDPPKILVSYSHDSLEHEQRVLMLADRLRGDGIDCMIDQYVLVPEEGWPLWMERQIRDSNFVLMVCTETYLKRVLSEEQPGKGLGVRWEGSSIYNAIYNAGVMNTKFIPLLFGVGDTSHIPMPLKGTPFYEPLTEAGYEDLYRRLTNQPRAVKPELGKLRSLPPAERKSEGAVGLERTLSNLPDRNPFFTGRERVLAQLQEALAAQSRAALSGLSGVGKTQTALEYAHHHLAEYSHVFLVTAASREGLLSGYVTIAGLLKLPEADNQDQMLAVDAVQRWFGVNEGWLLIFDNAATPDIVKPFLPPSPRGHILLTSRADVFDTIEIVKPVELNEMSPPDALTFLLKRTGREYEGGLESNAASELAAELGFLPLALEQAGAYIVRKKSLFQDYLKSFRNHRLELLNKHGPVVGGYRESVRTTWSMNFRQLEQESEAAADLLRLSAFLSPDSIPLEFLAAGAPELGNLLSAALIDVQEDPVVLDETLAPLTNFSLIRRQIETRSYSVHRLVQAVVRAEMDPKTQRLWAERAVRATNRAFPEVQLSVWHLCLRLLPQARACAELIKQWGFEFPEAARLLNAAGVYLCDRRLYSDAEALCQRALAIREKPWVRSIPTWPRASTA